MPRATASKKSPIIVLALLTSVVLTVVLAWQALRAADSQRRLAEQVLKDYSALIADEFVRRATERLGYLGFYDLLTGLQRAAGEAAVPPDMQQLHGGASGQSAQLASGVAFFWPGAGTISLQPDLDPETASRLRMTLQSLPTPTEAMRPFTLHAAVHDGRYVATVIAPASGAQQEPILIAFEVNGDAIGPWLMPVFDTSPLLPMSLVGAEFDNRNFHVSLIDPAGYTVLNNGGRYAPNMLVRRRLGEAYQGIFQDFELTAGIDPAVAPRLVIGGMPGSRLPLIVLLLLLSVGLVIAAIAQLRRERELIQMRTDFVARVSHELRTPLTQIRIFAETLLLGRVRSESDRLRALTIINRESQRLAHLVENVLQFSRGERQQVRLNMQELAIVPLIAKLVQEFEPLSDGCRIQFECQASPDLRVCVDGDALQQVLLNLLDNAIKYGPRGQIIRIVLRAANGQLTLAVEDRGPGIPKADRDRIWDGFYRLPRENRQAIAGTGIGLAVVAELIALHQGNCWVEANPGGGARFVVELPLVAGSQVSAPGAQGAANWMGVPE